MPEQVSVRHILIKTDHRKDADTLAQWLANKTVEQFLRTGVVETFCDGACDPAAWAEVPKYIADSNEVSQIVFKSWHEMPRAGRGSSPLRASSTTAFAGALLRICPVNASARCPPTMPARAASPTAAPPAPVVNPRAFAKALPGRAGANLA